MTRIRFVGLVGAAALVVAACGSTDSAAELSPVGDGTASPPAAGACLVGEPDCQDTFPDAGEPTGPPAPGVPVATVADASIDGGFAITGYYIADGESARLCEALAESFPPQCGGASIGFDNTAGADLGTLSIEQGVTWSEEPVLVTGRVVDGVFVADGA